MNQISDALGLSLKPTAPRRIDAMVIDPDGYAWILPYQHPDHLGESVEVVRVALATAAPLLLLEMAPVPLVLLHMLGAVLITVYWNQIWAG